MLNIECVPVHIAKFSISFVIITNSLVNSNIMVCTSLYDHTFCLGVLFNTKAPDNYSEVDVLRIAMTGVCVRSN